MPWEYSLALQNLVNLVETVLGDKATKNCKIDLDNKDEVSLFTTMLDEVRKNNPNTKFDENEIARILDICLLIVKTDKKIVPTKCPEKR